METQNLYYAQNLMKIIIDCDELKKGKTCGRSEVMRENEKEGKKEKQTEV